MLYQFIVLVFVTILSVSSMADDGQRSLYRQGDNTISISCSTGKNSLPCQRADRVLRGMGYTLITYRTPVIAECQVTAIRIDCPRNRRISEELTQAARRTI